MARARFTRWARETLPPILAFLALDLILTIVFFGITGASVHIGTLRPVATIPLKEIELVAVGLGVGLLASFANKAIDISLITLAIAFAVLIDFDHLPAAFGISQPIRPAHSLAFLALVIITLSFTIRKQPWIELIATSSFFAHLASDSGVFAFLAPVSFQYFSLDSVRIPFAVVSVTLALVAGYAKYRRRLKNVASSFEVKGVISKI